VCVYKRCFCHLNGFVSFHTVVESKLVVLLKAPVLSENVYNIVSETFPISPPLCVVFG